MSICKVRDVWLDIRVGETMGRWVGESVRKCWWIGKTMGR